MSRDVFETRLFGTLKWLSIVFFLVITLFPLVYMVSLSFKDIPEVVTDPGDVLPSWEQITSSETYQDVLRSRDEGGFGFVRFMTNSAIVSFLTVGVTVFFAIFGAYAAARLQFRGKKAVQSGILAIYLFPAVVTAIPLFVLFTRIRFGDLPLRSNLWSLAIVYLAQTIPVALYMLRSHFNSVPFSLEEAGMVDGLTRAQVIWKITFPLSARLAAAQHDRGPGHRTDGRLGAHLAAGDHPLLRRRAVPHRRPDRRRCEGLTAPSRKTRWPRLL